MIRRVWMLQHQSSTGLERLVVFGWWTGQPRSWPILANNREFAYQDCRISLLCKELLKSFPTGEVTAVEGRLLGKNNGAPEWWSVNGGESAKS